MRHRLATTSISIKPLICSSNEQKRVQLELILNPQAVFDNFLINKETMRKTGAQIAIK